MQHHMRRCRSSACKPAHAGRHIWHSGSICALSCSQARDPSCHTQLPASSAAACMYTGGAKARAAKQQPPTLDLFGWCTWDAFYFSVSARGIGQGLDSLRAGGTPPKWLVIDDGWQVPCDHHLFVNGHGMRIVSMTACACAMCHWIAICGRSLHHLQAHARSQPNDEHGKLDETLSCADHLNILRGLVLASCPLACCCLALPSQHSIAR